MAVTPSGLSWMMKYDTLFFSIFSLNTTTKINIHRELCGRFNFFFFDRNDRSCSLSAAVADKLSSIYVRESSVPGVDGEIACAGWHENTEHAAGGNTDDDRGRPG